MPYFNRNVRVFDGLTGAEIAGCWQFGGLTITTFYQWIHTSIIGPDSMRLFHCAGQHDLTRQGAPLNPKSSDLLKIGAYVLLGEDGSFIKVGCVLETPLPREYSSNDTSNDFMARVRNRDRRCCFTGRQVFGDNFTGFETAHIFPLGQTDERYITDPLVSVDDKMNPVQQGFLCLSTEHKLFDDYQIGVNPDGGYRITDFGCSNPNSTLDGSIFYIADVEERFRPSDALLREHYRQCVLACMKGVANLVRSRPFDPDIDLGPGGFSLEEGSWWSGPEGKAQMEVELTARLHHTVVARNSG